MARIYTAKTFDPKNSLGRLLRAVRKARIVLVEQELAEYGIRSGQVGVVLELFESGALTAADLSKRLDYDAGAMNRLLGRLQEKGIVRRIPPNDSDHRLRIELTRAGKALYPDIVRGLVNVYNHLLSEFTPTEVRQLKSLLRRIVDTAAIKAP